MYTMKRSESHQLANTKRAIKRSQRQARRDKREAQRIAKHGPRAKMTFRRHVAPVLAGILVMLLVVSGMNAQWLYAQYKYRNSSAGVAAAQPVAATKPGQPTDAPVSDPSPQLGSRIEIPAINVKAPVQLNQGTAEWQIQLGLRKGVVHLDGSAAPGKTGNVVIFGHSSGALWAPGDYKFIFTMLDKLKAGDQIFVYYEGIRYGYTVASSQVVAPSDVGVLNGGGQNELTLITCTPVGTSTNRLVVHAEQTSPKPAPSVAGDDAETVPASSLGNLPGSARR